MGATLAGDMDSIPCPLPASAAVCFRAGLASNYRPREFARCKRPSAGGFILAALPARIRHKLATAAGGEALEALRTPPTSRNLFARIFDRVEWFFGVSLLNIFPLPREAGFRDSFAFAGESVDRGYSVLVFPEGHHTTDGKMRPFRSGIGLLVNDLNIPVVSMRIDGLFELKQAGRRTARPHQIKVRIGAPVRFAPDMKAQEIAAQIQSEVEKL